MFNLLKEMLRPSVEEKLYILNCNRERLVDNIKNGKMVFVDNETMLEYANLLTDKLLNGYAKNKQLTIFEEKVLNKAIYDGIYRMSFLLSSHLVNEPDVDKVNKKMLKQGFCFLEDVGYINTDKIVHFVEI